MAEKKTSILLPTMEWMCLKANRTEEKYCIFNLLKNKEKVV